MQGSRISAQRLPAGLSTPTCSSPAWSMCTPEQLSSAGHSRAGHRALQRKALPMPSDQLTYGESDPGGALLSLGTERLIYREGPTSQEQILSGQILPSKGLAHPHGIPSNESLSIHLSHTCLPHCLMFFCFVFLFPLRCRPPRRRWGTPHTQHSNHAGRPAGRRRGLAHWGARPAHTVTLSTRS